MLRFRSLIDGVRLNGRLDGMFRVTGAGQSEGWDGESEAVIGYRARGRYAPLFGSRNVRSSSARISASGSVFDHSTGIASAPSQTPARPPATHPVVSVSEPRFT